MQLGTSDGRVKVVGQEGVEMSIVSPSPSGTKHLQFLPGRGAVLRVNLVRIRPVPLACLRHPAFSTLSLHAHAHNPYPNAVFL